MTNSNSNHSNSNIVDAWDDWETAADSGLADYKKISPKSQTNVINTTTTNATNTTTDKEKSIEERNTSLWKQANEYTTPTIVRTDTVQTQYQPEIQILKRSSVAVKGRFAGSGTNIRSKTLQEREKEYKLARQRIFDGSKEMTQSNKK